MFSHLWVSSINPQTTSDGEDVEKGESLFTVGGNADWCSHCGKQYGDTSKVELHYDPAIPVIFVFAVVYVMHYVY